MSWTTIRAPRSAIRTAWLRPMPLPDPVISAVLPSSDFVIAVALPPWPCFVLVVPAIVGRRPRRNKSVDLTMPVPAFRPSALAIGGLAAAFLGGWAFDAIGTPIPWLLGPLFVVAGANLAGLRLACPAGGRQLGQILIGTAIGLRFSPEVSAIVAGQIHWMVIAALAAILLGGLGAWIQMRLAGLDGPTAFFGSVPGGMAEMLALGDRFRAEPVALAVSQTVRVGIIVLTVPAGLTYLGEAGDAIFQPMASMVDWRALPLLLGGAVASALILNRAGMTNAWMLGACAFAAAITLAEIELSGLPGPFLILGQLLIGAALGERFEREPMRRAPLVIVGAAISTTILLAAGIVLALGIAAASGISVSTMIAATCPGGLAEMSITAQVLGLGVPLVTAYHITRIIMITVVTLPLFRLVRRA